MSLIKSAIVYRAEIPAADGLQTHLEAHAFQPPMLYQAQTFGFVPPYEADSEQLVATFPGGMAFAVRIDDKIMPGSVIRAETERLIAKTERDTGRKPGKKERRILKEEAITALLAIAMVKTTAIVTCFYHVETKTLIVPVTSKRLADICTTLLVRAIESMKTETIHVSDVKHGLTARLKQWLAGTEEDGEGFGEFYPRDSVALAQEKRKLTVQMGSLQEAHHGLQEALSKGFTVTSIGFQYDAISFRMGADFRLSRIEFSDDHMDADTDQEWWPLHAKHQVDGVVKVVHEMCELLKYRGPEIVEASENEVTV